MLYSTAHRSEINSGPYDALAAKALAVQYSIVQYIFLPEIRIIRLINIVEELMKKGCFYCDGSKNSPLELQLDF